MTRIITSVAVLQLFGQNELLLTQPVTDFIPELKTLKVFAGGTTDAFEVEEIKTPITIKVLLNHTAVLPMVSLTNRRLTNSTQQLTSGTPAHLKISWRAPQHCR